MSPKQVTDRILKLEWLLDPETGIVMDKLQKLDESQKRIEDKFDCLLEKLDTKYASKWVEVSVKRVAWIIIGIVISTMVYQVIIK